MQTLEESKKAKLSQPGISRAKFANSINYWRRKRGYTWKRLAEEIGLKNYPPLLRAAQTLKERSPAGGALGREAIAKLSEVLKVEIWQLYVPAEDSEKFFG